MQIKKGRNRKDDLLKDNIREGIKKEIKSKKILKIRIILK